MSSQNIWSRSSEEKDENKNDSKERTEVTSSQSNTGHGLLDEHLK
jgi:hypothetical protein